MLWSFPEKMQAQSFPIPEGVGVSVRPASYGMEIHVPIRISPKWDLGAQAIFFWADGYYSNLSEFNNFGLKARYFFRPRNFKIRHYLGMIVVANGYESPGWDGFSTNFRPIFGTAYGFEYNLVDRWLKLGLELQGGIGLNGHGYLGLGISAGFYH